MWRLVRRGLWLISSLLAFVLMTSWVASDWVRIDASYTVATTQPLVSWPQQYAHAYSSDDTLFTAWPIDRSYQLRLTRGWIMAWMTVADGIVDAGSPNLYPWEDSGFSP